VTPEEIMSKALRLALIGAGFIGRSHALAIAAVNRVFTASPLRAIPFVLAEADEERARSAAAELGFEKWTTDWQAAIDMADAVIVAVPSFLHAPVVRGAIAQRKPVLCEKPVGLSSEEAASLATAAAEAGVVNAVGFTYLRAPMVRHAKALLDSGTLGRPVHFYGRHAEDYLADPKAPHNWRLSIANAGRAGALGDLGYHILAIARFLCGPIEALSGLARTVHPQRRAGNIMKPVENEDYAGALLRFAGGAVGTMEASRIAHGRKMDIAFELVCERGTIAFDGERMNELKLFLPEDDAATAGFRTILVNTAHPDFGRFLPAAGHGLGFNDLKTIELGAFLEGVAAGRNVYPDLGEACRISRVCEATLDSSEAMQWVRQPEAAPAPKGVGA
jgi:predicted dehydrogenase